MAEKELIGRAKKGDKQAFAELYGLYKDRLYRYAYYRLGSIENAEDAVVDTVIAAYEQLSQLKKASAFGAWLFRIHYVTCSKYISEQIKQRETADINVFENSVKTAKYINTLSAELNEGLNILNEQEKEIVLLSVISGFSSKEISKIVGLRDGSVRSKLSRSLAKMREFLGNE